MSATYLTHQEAQQLIFDLRQKHFREDAIYSELIAEGIKVHKAKNSVESTHPDPQLIQRNGLLSAWLMLHKFIVVPSIMLFFMLLGTANHGGGTLLFVLLLIDACIQYKCINELWDNNIKGFYGLMILFTLRFILMPSLNLIDAIFLCVAVYTSRTKVVRKKAKRKRKAKG
ncbi:MAG: hypothetical protein Phog2KO_11950 [Phototrophicaceae bacterium]